MIFRGFVMVTMALALAGSVAAQQRLKPGSSSLSPPAPVTCMVSATPLQFGSIVGGMAGQTATVSVTCPAGLPYAIAISAGRDGDATIRGFRTGDGPRLTYELYQDPSRRVVWGDRSLANTYPRGEAKTAIGTGMPQAHPVFGILDTRLKSPPAAGTYTDALTVAVHF